MSTMRTGSAGSTWRGDKFEIGVEHGEAQPRHRLGIGDAQRHGQEQQRRREQDMERERAQGDYLIEPAPHAPRRRS